MKPGRGDPDILDKEAERAVFCGGSKKDPFLSTTKEELEWRSGGGSTADSAPGCGGGTTKRILSRAASMASKLVY